MPVLRINNIDMHTMVQGEQGPLLVMLHGLVVGSVATWCFDFAPVLARHFRVVMFDMRGHGKSEQALSGYDVNTLADDLAELIAYYQEQFSLQDQAVHVVGHSYGAIVALNYACQAQRQGWPNLASLVIIDAPLPAMNFIAPSLDEFSSEDAIERECQRLSTWMGLKPGRRQEKLKRHLQFLYLQSSLKSDLVKTDAITDERLQTVTCPVRLIYGRQSDCYSVAERLLKVLPAAQLSSFDCGHYITMEQPEALRETLVQHFEECTDGRW